MSQLRGQAESHVPFPHPGEAALPECSVQRPCCWPWGWGRARREGTATRIHPSCCPPKAAGGHQFLGGLGLDREYDSSLQPCALSWGLQAQGGRGSSCHRAAMGVPVFDSGILPSCNFILFGTCDLIFFL